MPWGEQRAFPSLLIFRQCASWFQPGTLCCRPRPLPPETSALCRPVTPAPPPRPFGKPGALFPHFIDGRLENHRGRTFLNALEGSQRAGNRGQGAKALVQVLRQNLGNATVFLRATQSPDPRGNLKWGDKLLFILSFIHITLQS